MDDQGYGYAFNDGRQAEREALLEFLAEQQRIADENGKILSARWVIDAIREGKHLEGST